MVVLLLKLGSPRELSLCSKLISFKQHRLENVKEGFEVGSA